MSSYVLTRSVVGATKKILWRTLYRPIHEAAENQQISNEETQPDLPVQLQQNPYQKPRVQCILCKHNIEPDYKNVRLLSQFQSRYTGRIYGRHITGLCKSKQAKVEKEILKAQNAGFMAYYFKDVTFVKDPQLFDPDHPFRPHNF
ncbi:28S ribosomal protein S18c, mitochondrial [Diprion similis]|uniref:28S ribosomal protein S18c, mitochondrial n=1 Tax=Diprion similis TaxID=362088 RepID=UPI001EF94CAC|nr:28S ribosomal protein S18c, mitochondrial [Diprion similis]